MLFLPQVSFSVTGRDVEGINFALLTEVESQLALPNKFALLQNYPNPFNPTTTIKYELPVQAKVSIKIYTLLGQLLEEVVHEDKEAGYYKIEWNPSSVIASGVYFYRIEATALDNSGGRFMETKKMLLIR